MSLATLEAFLDAASADPRLQELLLSSPDAATLAAIARGAGFAVSEADWLQSSGAEPQEQAAVAEPEPPDADPLTAFLHQAQGDEELQGALAEALDAADVAAIARAAGYPITAADLWAVSAAAPGAGSRRARRGRQPRRGPVSGCRPLAGCVPAPGGKRP
jgi:predicted ribosomally synthesized peptide with nif11-like leader